jgi:hypothetical protein
VLETVTYRLFGFIPLWTVTRVVGEDELYARFAKRFDADLAAAVARARGGK